MLNMFRTLIYPSSGACDFSIVSPHWLCVLVSMCVGVSVWLGWGGICVAGWSLPHWNISNIHLHFVPCTVYVGDVADEVLLEQIILRACSLFCDFMQRRLVFYYRRFGTTYRSHPQETKIRDWLTLEAVSLVLPDDGQRGSKKWVCFTLTLYILSHQL